MKIIRLSAENIKRLSAVEITPTGAVVEITGKNRAGKTSVLDSIWWALSGERDIQARPIRRGAEKAHVTLDLGELRVTRRFSAQEDGGFSTSLVVENADGARYPSPQKRLDALIGSLSLDPLEFARSPALAQLETLKRLTGLDFAEMEAANKADFATRTDVRRRGRDLRSAAAMIAVPADAPTERIDEAALVRELERAGEHNSALEQRKARREGYATATERLRERWLDLRGRAEALRREAAALDAEAATIGDDIAARTKTVDEAAPLAEPIDTATVRQSIEEARRTNEIAASAARKADLERQAKAADGEADGLTQSMEARSVAKAKMIAEVAMPIPGLSLGDEGVMLDGQPFDQGSDEEQLRASIAIAAAMNPTLRIVRIRDGALLDAESMALLAVFAAERDLQVWIETVESGRPEAVVIEDGHVRGAEPPDEPRQARETA